MFFLHNTQVKFEMIYLRIPDPINTHIKCLCLHTLSPVAKKKYTLFHFSDVSAVFEASSEFISEWEKNNFFAHKVMWYYNKQ